ncbi:MAG: hypothetical protein H6617_03100 [Bdellovibrionaceae bacterium]|nr:hypothetical protein [Pseudobdellovibrionaceae bacterium]
MSASTALYGTPRVGGDILAHCTRCKMELAHVIVSMVGGSPAKVQCKTCKSERKFRGSSGARRVVPGRSAPSRPRARGSALWDEKLAASSGKETQAYTPRTTFQSGDVLKHVKFGIGIVEEVRANGKIIVLFREGERMLIHAMS